MKKMIYTFSVLFFLISSVNLFAQNVPELMYFKFMNNTSTTTQNFASSPVGTVQAPYTGNVVGPGGQFDSCMIGTGATGTNGVLPGWNCDLGSSNWTIGFWVKDLVEVTAGNPVYLFGDPGSTSFRCFYGGFALPDNIVLRGPLADIIVPCPMPGPQYIHFVYDGANVIAYRNGVLVSTNPRTINMPTGSGFRVAGYTGGVFALNSNGKMDEFRLYNRALSAAEVAATWNIQLPAGGPTTCSYSWGTQTSGSTSQFLTTSAVSDQIGWAAGVGPTVRRTTDGGTSWTNATGTGITGDVYNIYAWTANDAICTTSPAATFIYKTSNGGTSWTQVYTLAGGFINAIQMISATEGYAEGDPVGGTWTILKTIDGGNSWARMTTEPVQVGAEAGWNNSFLIIGTNIWFGTNSTKVYHSTNLGVNWTSGPTTGTANSYAVHFNSATNGLACGTAMVATTDGGTTYTTVTSPTAGTMNALEGSNTDWWATVTGASVYRSTNGGTNWSTAYTQTGAIFRDLDFSVGVSGCPIGWAVGDAGAIAKMTGMPVGISNNTGGEIPDSYLLKQNFPNPFNPTTNINFSIPKSGLVTLKVYDMTGKEVSTLVNEVRNAGSYIVGFNASNLPSGTYFYRITAGNFVDTKKMMLIK